MKKRTALLVVILIAGFAGCSSGTTPAPDPFFGRVTISPPSTNSGAAASSYAPPATVAAPVSPNVSQPGQAWPSPAPPNFGQNSQVAPVAPPYGSVASTSQPQITQPTRPIYLSQAAIEESVRQPSYTPGSTSSFARPSQPIAAAGSGRTASPARAASPMQIYPAPDLQAVNGQPVREQNNITYRSADGTVPQYGDPRSSFGRTPRDRFKQNASSSAAPAWNQGSASNTPERVNPLNFNTAQPRVSPGTLTSSAALEKSLPPIRGYAPSRQPAWTQATSSQTARVAMPYRSQGRQLASNLSPAFRRPRSLPTFAPAGPGEPRIMPIPPTAIDIADLPDVSRIASRPSNSRSSGTTRRLNYETPATDRSTPSVQRDVQIRPVSFSPAVHYNHNEDYSRLRGELEYSEIDQRWKLRYISVSEEKTDDYGGSVILSEATKLSGFERGDFIEVSGRILSGPQNDLGYARGYEVREIRRIQ